MLPVCRHNCFYNRLKSCRGNCPYTSLAPGSSVQVTAGDCKFPMGKGAGRSEGEPMCSLVNLNWRCRLLEHQGKAVVFEIGKRKHLKRSLGEAGMVCIGRRTAQCWRPNAVALQSRQWMHIKIVRKCTGPCWESEGFIVPFEDKGQHYP